MTRIALLSSEPIRPLMAGIGIRYLELARRLPAYGIDVVLVSPAAPEETAALGGLGGVRGPPLRARAPGGDPRRLRRRRGPGAARQRPRPRAARPAGGDRPLRSLADRELRLLRDPRARPLPQRPRDLAAPDVARRLLPLLVRGAADLLPRLPRRPRPGEPRADRGRSGPRDAHRARPLRRAGRAAAAPPDPAAARGRRAAPPLRRPLRLVRPLDAARRPGGRSTARGPCCSSATPTRRARRSACSPRSRRAAARSAGGGAASRSTTGCRPSGATTCCATSISWSLPTGRASRPGCRCAPASSTPSPPAARW